MSKTPSLNPNKMSDDILEMKLSIAWHQYDMYQNIKKKMEEGTWTGIHMNLEYCFDQAKSEIGKWEHIIKDRIKRYEENGHTHQFKPFRIF